MKNLWNWWELMTEVKKILAIGLLILLMTLIGSCVHSPWEKGSYWEENTGKIGLIDEIPDTQRYDNYYINGVFFVAKIGGEGLGWYVEQAPYFVGIRAQGYAGEHKSFIIENLRISSSLRKKYNVQENFPIEVDLKPISWVNQKNNIGFLQGVFLLSDEYEFSPVENEIITVDVTVTVVSGEKSVTGTIRYILYPKVTKGYFKYFM